MTTSLPRSGLPALVCCWLAVACGTTQHAVPQQPAARPAPNVPAPSSRPAGLYSAEEALRDALSGPWQYVGRGDWPGINRVQACAYRNERVLVVNVYCTRTETQAFRVDVYSPSRGRVRIYAESRGQLSAHMRQDYFTFAAETEPLPSPGANLPPVALTMSFEALSTYDEKRHNAFLPACYGGTELSRQRAGCLGTLAPRASEWTARNHGFLERANDDWYRLVRDMRALAAQHGRDPA
jgi:hypothetical protein